MSQAETTTSDTNTQDVLLMRLHMQTSQFGLTHHRDELFPRPGTGFISFQKPDRVLGAKRTRADSGERPHTSERPRSRDEQHGKPTDG